MGLEVKSLLRPRALRFGVLAASASVAVQAIPTAVIPNPLFTRMTTVRPEDYVFVAATSILIGLIAATFGLPRATLSCTNRTVGSGVLSALAVGCPICNHVVVALVGISGALTYWAPIQPLLGLAAVSVLLWTLRRRLQGVAGEARFA